MVHATQKPSVRILLAAQLIAWHSPDNGSLAKSQTPCILVVESMYVQDPLPISCSECWGGDLQTRELSTASWWTWESTCCQVSLIIVSAFLLARQYAAEP